MKYVGKVPKDMERPTIGRKDHLKGYQPGNCGWQEYRDNCSESARRNSPGRLRDKKTKAKMSKAQQDRRNKERKNNDGKRCFYHKKKSRKQMSKSHKGLIISKKTRSVMKLAQIERRKREVAAK